MPCKSDYSAKDLKKLINFAVHNRKGNAMSTYKARKPATTKSKFTNLRLLTTSALTATGLIASGHALAQNVAADALPQGAVVTKGDATYQYSDKRLDITQNNRGVTAADYHGGFNIGKDAGVYVDQRTGDIFVHRDTSNNTSHIEGLFKGSASNLVLNKNGVLISGSARIDMHSFATSTADSVNFDEGQATFENLGDGEIIIESGADITVAEGGVAAFVAPTVKNAGVINAKLGKVAFAAGEKVTVDLYGDGLFEVAVEGELADAYLENTGTINAQGGNVQMSARAAKDVADNIINLDGVVDVSSATQVGGKIILSGGDQGTVAVKGKADASGKDGGKVEVTSQNIEVADTAEIKTDGGLDADKNGDGGTVNIIANNAAIFRGKISAKGGGKGGDGGNVETSGHLLQIGDGFVDASAKNGNNGSWLLDPYDLTVVAGTGITNITDTGAATDPRTGTSNGLGSTVGATTLSNVLSGGTSVILQTGAGGPANGGNLTVDAAVTHSGGDDVTLSLQAHNDIFINEVIEASGGGKLNVDLIADYDLSGGDADIFVLNDINTNGGAFTATASDDIDIKNDATITTDGGDVNILSRNTGDGSWLWMPNGGAGTGTINTSGGAFSVTTQNLNLATGSEINLGNGNGEFNVEYARLGEDIVTTGTLTGTATNVDIQNNNAQIKDGIDLAASGATVNVGAGTYNEKLVINKAVDLIGAGVGSTTIDVAGTSFYGLQVTADNVGLEGFTLQGSNTGTFGIKATGDDLTLTDLLVQGFGRSEIDLNGVTGATFTNVTADGQNTAGVGIALSNVTNATLTNVTTQNNNWGGVGLFDYSTGGTSNIVFDAASAAQLNEINPVYIDTAFGFDVTDIVLPGFEHAVRNSAFRPDGANFTFFQRTEQDAIDYAVNLDGAGTTIDSSVETLGSDTNGFVTYENNFIVGEDSFGTSMFINPAVDEADAGGTINIRAGSYEEGDINIDKNLLISGAGTTQTTIDASGFSNGFIIDSDLGNTNTTLRRMSVENANGAGVRVSDTANLKVLQMNQMAFNNNGLHGVAVYGNSMKELRILNSDFLDNGALGGSNGEGDILAYFYDGDVTLKNVSIENNVGGTLADYGVQIRSSSPFVSGVGFTNRPNSGTIDIDNVEIKGDYRAALFGVQGFADLDLSVNDFILGGQTLAGTDSAAGFSALYLESTASGDFDLGNTIFNTLTGKYLNNYTGLDIDATDATFEGVLGADATVAESFAIEDRINHQMDFPILGLVTWKQGELFVTSNTAGIQNAINIADAGDTVNVDDSTYTEDLLIDKALKLTGHGTTLESAGGDNLITVTASDVNIDPFTFDGMGALYGVNATGLGALGLVVDGNTFKNFTRAGIYLEANSGSAGTSTIINNTFEGSSTRGVQTGNLRGPGYELNIADNTIGTFGDEVRTGLDIGRVINAKVNVERGTIDATGDAVYFRDGTFNTSEVTLTDVIASSTNDEGLDVQGIIRENGTFTINGGAFSGGNNGVEFQKIDGDVALNDVTSIGQSKRGLNLLGTITGSLKVDGGSYFGLLDGIGSNNGNNDVDGGIVEFRDAGISGGLGNGIALGALSNNADVKIQNNTITSGEDGVKINGTITDSKLKVARGTITSTGDGVSLVEGIGQDGKVVVKNIEINADANGVSAKKEIQSDGKLNVVGATIDALQNGVDLDLIAGQVNIGKDGVVTEIKSGIDGVASTLTSGVIPGGEVNIVYTDIEAGANGINLNSVDTSTITNNEITALRDGIKVNTFASTNVSYNEISGTGYDGIDINNGDSTVVLDNEISTVGDNGIEVSDADNAIIELNTITGADNDGINVDNSDGAQIIDNEIYGSATASVFSSSSSIQGAGRDAIHVENSHSVIIDGNTVQGDSAFFRKEGLGAGRHGIYVSGGNTLLFGNGVKITNNNILGETGFLQSADSVGEDGIHVTNNNAGLFGASPEISGNEVERTGENGIYINGASFASVDNNDVTGTGDDGIQVVNSFNADVINNRVSLSGDDGIDVESSAFVNVNDNIVTFTGDDGIDIENSFDADIISNLITSVSGDAIELTNGFGADIRENVVLLAGDDGIDVRNSNFVDIADNSVALVAANGIEVQNSDNTDIENNFVGGTGENGIDVSASDDINIDSNIALATNGDGIQVNAGENADVTNNLVFLTGDNGINVNNNTGNVNIADNTISLTLGDGIEASNNADGMIITNNSVILAGDDGIDVQSSRNARIDDNTIENVGANGIEITDNSRRTRARNNTISNTGENGIYVENSNRVRTNDNIIDNVSESGIYFDGVNAGRANRNAISNSGENGILINNSSNNVRVEENVITGSLVSGIEVNNVDGINILQNNISDNGVFGLLVSGPSNGDVTLVGNTFTDNPTGARFESGNIDISDLTDPNIFTNTDPLGTPVGLQFDEVGIPGSLTIAGNTLGATIFDGFTNAGSFYARIENGTLLDTGTGEPIVINGLQASFDGFIPASVGGILTLPQLTFLEDRLFDADDLALNGRGQIFVGSVPGLNPEDFIREIGLNQFGAGPLSVTFRNLPAIDGTSLVNIEPAAGGEGETPDDLANIEPAAGGENAACWGDAIATASAGVPVNYSFGGSFEQSIADASRCQSQEL